MHLQKCPSVSFPQPAFIAEQANSTRGHEAGGATLPIPHPPSDPCKSDKRGKSQEGRSRVVERFGLLVTAAARCRRCSAA